MTSQRNEAGELAYPEPATLVVDLATATVDDRLAALYAAYPEAKAKKDAAEAELKAITDGIKSALTGLSPDLTQTPKFELRGPGGVPLRLAWQVTRRLDTKALAQHPVVVQHNLIELHRKPSGTWVLAPIKAGE